MALTKLSGVAADQTIDVDKDKAEQSFLVMVHMNLFDLKGLLLSNANVTFGPFKTWYVNQGYNWDRFTTILNG